MNTTFNKTAPKTQPMADELVLEAATSPGMLLGELKKLQSQKTDTQRIRIKGLELSGFDFRGADLSNCIIDGGDFSNCDFREVPLQGTEFRGVALRQAKFGSADLDGAEFDKACDCFMADFSGADAARTKFLGTALHQAVFNGADLPDADFIGASLKDASFERAKLFRVTGFKPDHTNIGGAMFSAGAPDAWSRLKRNYTGVRLILNLVGLGVFIAAISAKAFGLYGAAMVQVSAVEGLSAPTEATKGLADVISSFCSQAGSPCREVHLWEVLLGLTQGWSAFVYVMASILSNAVRFGLTLTISQMEQEESKSGYTPNLDFDPPPCTLPFPKSLSWLAQLPKSYGWIVPVDCFMSAAKWVLLALLGVSLWDLAMTTIILPT